MFKPARKYSSLQLLISVFLVASLFFLGISNVGASSSSATGDKMYGGTLDDEAAAIVQADDGGYAIAGTTYSFGAGDSDFWLVKVDSSGNMQWKSTYSGLGDSKALFTVQTDDGGYTMAGTTQSNDEGTHYDIWFTKADPSGEIIPEFPSWTILSLTMMAALIVTLMKRRRLCAKKL